MRHGIACNSAGGSHHAGPRGGAGFCTFNDVAVATTALRARGAVERVLVVDCDAHQGDGTALAFADEPNVYTLSIHAERNYPFEKAVSDLDIGLPDGVGDDAYLAVLADALNRALAAGPFNLAFYNAGVDVHVDDRLGRLGPQRRRPAPQRPVRAGDAALPIDPGRLRDRRRLRRRPAALAERHAIVFEEAARILDGDAR